MPHLLKQLLGSNHPLFSANLASLEKATGHAGVDVKLLADITERGHHILRSLGLDPSNTTGLEAYNALKNIGNNEASLGRLEDTGYVLLNLDGDLVSFNKQDVIENMHHQLSFTERIYSHAQRHLRAEIVRRYAEHDRTHDELVYILAKEIGLKPQTDEGYPTSTPQESGNKPKLLAIGDIFTDAFIQLSDDSARIDTDPDGSKRLSLPYGAKPSYDHVDIVKSVGPSPNAAISAARLGLDVSLMAWLGNDQPGKESLDHLRSEGVHTEYMVTEPDKKSSYWYVLRYQTDRTMLVKSEAYGYAWSDPVVEPDWVYLSYIGADSWPFHEQLLRYLDQHQQVKLAFQPGTFHFKWGVEKLKDVYRRSYIVVLNREEAMDITGKPHGPIDGLTKAIHELGPKIVVITDGPNGSYASYDWKVVTIPNYPDPAPPLDRTGAGDAFASTIVAALAQGETMETALRWAPINSMSVVQQLGAQKGLLSKEKIEFYLQSAPEEYKVREINE